MSRSKRRQKSNDDARDAAIAANVADWFRREGRVLPWRRTPRDPYFSLVSEAMLQQTQVSRVVAAFEQFIARFPTINDLAEANEQDVLSAWKGLGYYRRARHLHEAAKRVATVYEGVVPRSVQQLQTLPGVGAYTAGAVASLVFDQPAPLVDGNVQRVLLRIDGLSLQSGSKEAERHCWTHAGSLVAQAESPGVFNEGLMELGALICTPRTPICQSCPVRRQCIACEEGTQASIPLPKERPHRRELHCSAVVVRDSRRRILLEQRGQKGLWAGMWQAPTVEGDGRHATASELRAMIGLARVRRRQAFEHHTTHRLVRFEVWEGRLGRGQRPRRGRFFGPEAARTAPMSNAQRRIIFGET